MNPDTSSEVRSLFGDPALFDGKWPNAPYCQPGVAALLPALTLHDIDSLVNDRYLRTPNFRMVKDGETLAPDSISRPREATSARLEGLADPVRIREELSDGATLILQGLSRIWPPLRDLCRRLSTEIGHPVFANAYLTPPSGRGFKVHRDWYHAWLAQTAGKKLWQLWAPRANPATDQADLEITLTEGDVLWIPRGWWHAGASLNEPSLHVTFTLWATKVEDVLNEILADNRVKYRLAQELPPSFPADGERAAAAVRGALVEIRELLASVDVDTLTTRFLDGNVRRFDPLPSRSITADAGARHHVHPEGVLYRAQEPSGMRIGTADTTITIPQGQVAAFEALLSRSRRTVSGDDDLAGLDQDLVDRLIRARILCFAHCEMYQAD